MTPLVVCPDTDVCIASLLSHTGAGSLLFSLPSDVLKFQTTNLLMEELERGAKRLSLKKEDVAKLKQQLKIHPLPKEDPRAFLPYTLALGTIK